MRKIAVKWAAITAMAVVCVWAGRAYGQVGSPDRLARGAKVYATSCQPCHGDQDGKGSIGRAHPHNNNGHTWHHPDPQLKEWILQGKPGPGFSVMPAFNYLTDEDVEAILLLIKTWWTAEQRASQADISQRYQEAIDKSKPRR
ncbi:MAG: c-type cytochrome [Candidatus Binatia bacterium]